MTTSNNVVRPLKRKRNNLLSDWTNYIKLACFSTRNELTPHEMFISSPHKIIWECDSCPHEWEARVRDVTKQNGSWCPFCCVNSKVFCSIDTCQHCFDRSFATHPMSNWWSERNDVEPHRVTKSTHQKFWFDCTDCSREFLLSPSKITNMKRGCPHCGTERSLEAKRNMVPATFEQSFASYDEDKVAQWSSGNDKSPKDVYKRSTHKFWFDCLECNHSFEASLNNITAGKWCPYCNNSKLCGSDGCDKCFQKSFASVINNDVRVHWSSRNERSPREVTKYCNSCFWFDCVDCKHSFEAKLGHVTSGSYCGFCANKKICGEESCEFCLSKSFAAFDDKKKLESFSSNNTFLPHEIMLGSEKKVLFDCYNCKREFSIALYHVTGTKRQWCSFCKLNKMVTKIIELMESYNTSVKIEVEETVVINERRLRWDITVNWAGGVFRVESDGAQHLSEAGMAQMSRLSGVDPYNAFVDQVERDWLKNRYAARNKLLLFRVSYRQYGDLSELVKHMFEYSAHGETGVKMMDFELYSEAMQYKPECPPNMLM